MEPPIRDPLRLGQPLYKGRAVLQHHANTLVYYFTSEIGTTSLQGTKLLYSPNVSLVQRFHCIILVYVNVVTVITIVCSPPTVNMFLDTKKGFISQDAVLVTLQPLEISGVKRAESHLFSQFIPFG